MIERLSNSTAQLGTILNWPQRQQRLYARDGLRSRRIVRNQRHVRQSEILAEAFIIPEQKQLVLHQRAAKRTAKLVALKDRNIALIKIVAGIERAVTDEFKRAAVQLICA